MNRLSDETLAKFCACFGFSNHDIQRRKKPDETFYIEMGLNVQAFKKMLIKNDMEEYTDLLLFYWHMQIIYSTKSSKYKVHNPENVMRIRDFYEKDLTETLVFLLDDKAGKNTSITFQKSRNSTTKKNKDIIKNIISALISEYDKNNFNLEALTFEEAKEEIYYKYDREWIDNYLQEMVRLNPHIFAYEFDEYNSEYNFNEVFEHFNDDLMVESYANEHYIKRDITLEFLKNRLSEISLATKKRVGAKPKNNHIAVIGTDLSYLKRIDRFIESRENIKDSTFASIITC